MKENNFDFAKLLKDFANIANDPTADPARYAESLETLATACARSVINKVIDPTRHSANNNIVVTANTVGKAVYKTFFDEKKKETVYTSSSIDGLTMYSEGKQKTAVDSGFNPALVQVRKDLNKAVADLDSMKRAREQDDQKAVAYLTTNTIGDGLDLVNDAVVAILSEIEEQKKRDPSMPVDLEREYTVNRLKSKVYIKEQDSKGGFETVTTTPIQEIYKHVRRAVASSRAVSFDPSNGYVYLEDLMVDDETGEQLEVYRRLPKFSDLGGHVCDFNGHESFENIADAQTVMDFDEMCEQLNMTDRQRHMVDLKMSGYGNTAVATYFGVKTETIETTMKRLQKRAVEKFNLPPSMLEKPEHSKSDKKVTAEIESGILEMFNSGLSKTYIAQHYNLGRATVNRVLDKIGKSN